MQVHQAELRKELGIVDVVLAQSTYIVTLEFFGTAVKAGSSHAVLWLTAIALFFVPQALVVTYLNKLMPLEGGLYEWARLVFNDATGFLVAWNLWLYIVFLVAEYGFVLTTYVAFALGPDAAWMRLAAASGFIVTLLFVGLSIFPVIDVPNPAFYAWKTVAVVVGANILGGVFYISSRQQHAMAE